MTKNTSSAVFDPALGAIHDLTVASEFLMVALRAITSTQKIEDRTAQEFIDLTLCKLRPLLRA
ncbi:hypothetical protein [Tabrizicola oligotrophica]|uniref:Uncharacterized protein n=1 Tax=Tabrizicola oligotrophica TaxID=2710650 RepID=A0A6M0QWA5_9RHOB|nr:hypothetical protein [Tabrizicola oligotrophica]NEY91687.1 hypothetical protein [Tabrizicola oligotrophica]